MAYCIGKLFLHKERKNSYKNNCKNYEERLIDIHKSKDIMRTFMIAYFTIKDT